MNDARRFGAPRPNGKPAAVPSDGIPIIGQAFQVKGGFPTVSLQCSCPAREPVLLVSNAPAQCPACKRAFMIANFTFNGQTGQIQVNVGIVQAPEPERVEVPS